VIAPVSQLVLLAESESFNPLAFDPSAMVLTLATFFVLLVVLTKFAWGPILRMAETREKRITDALQQAESQRAETQRMLEDHRRALSGAAAETASLRERGRQEVETLRQQLKQKAEAEAEAIMQKARHDIEQARLQALQDLRREAVNLSLAAATRVVGRSLDGADQRRIAEDVVGGLSSVGGGSRS